MHAVSKDHFTRKDDISRGNALTKCCSPDSNKFKTVFESSVSLLVREILRFSRSSHFWQWVLQELLPNTNLGRHSKWIFIFFRQTLTDSWNFFAWCSVITRPTNIQKRLNPPMLTWRAKVTYMSFFQCVFHVMRSKKTTSDKETS